MTVRPTAIWLCIFGCVQRNLLHLHTQIGIYFQPSDEVRSLLLAVGVTYLARLDLPTRQSYAKHTSRLVEKLMKQTNCGDQILLQQLEL